MIRICRILPAAVLLLLAVRPLGATDDAVSPLRRAVDELRTGAVSLFEWYEASNRTVPSAPEGLKTLDVTSTTVIDAARARELGWPAGILALIEGKDPWGHAYEVRLGDGETTPMLVVRSPGANGRFEGDRYAIGPFHAGDPDDDLVWYDGYFARWPQRRK